MTLLSCLGLVWIVKDSYIFSIPRNYLKSKSKTLNELLSCSLCLGFWFGLIVEFSLTRNYISSITFALASSCFCWFFDSLLDLIQESTVAFKNNKNES